MERFSIKVVVSISVSLVAVLTVVDVVVVLAVLGEAFVGLVVVTAATVTFICCFRLVPLDHPRTYSSSCQYKVTLS